MKRMVVGLVALGFFALLLCTLLLCLSHRYHLASVGRMVYRVDRFTGKTTAIYGSIASAVQEQQAPIGDPAVADTRASQEQQAITLVQEASVGRGNYREKYKNYAAMLEAWTRSLKGVLKVLGWQATRMDDNVFLVSYLVRHNGTTRGEIFEVDVRAQLVRNVFDDVDLRRHYQAHIAQEQIKGGGLAWWDMGLPPGDYVSLLSPRDYATVESDICHLEWARVETAEVYRVQVYGYKQDTRTGDFVRHDVVVADVQTANTYYDLKLTNDASWSYLWGVSAGRRSGPLEPPPKLSSFYVSTGSTARVGR